jgi:hypothetical protein
MTVPFKAPRDLSPAEDLARRLAGPAYQGYAYGYPHKTAYAPLTPSRLLANIWAGEPKRALELYVHVPFCAMRNWRSRPRKRRRRQALADSHASPSAAEPRASSSLNNSTGCSPSSPMRSRPDRPASRHRSKFHPRP